MLFMPTDPDVVFLAKNVLTPKIFNQSWNFFNYKPKTFQINVGGLNLPLTFQING